MRKIRVNLDTKTQLNTFIHLCGKQEFPVFLTDGTHQFRVNAKSMLGCIMAQVEWESVFCEYEDQYGGELESLLRTHNLILY